MSLGLYVSFNIKLSPFGDGVPRDIVHDKENVDLYRVEGRVHSAFGTRALRYLPNF